MCSRDQNRRGVVIPLVALLMTLLLGMVAFTVDLGYLTKTRQELQTSADAAALAGATQLLNRNLLIGDYSAAFVISDAQFQAKKFANLNAAANVPIQLSSNATNSVAGDMVCGYLANPRDPNCVLTTTTTPFNAVKVIARRDSQANGSLNLFFARVLGTGTADLTASATAVYAGNVQGFKISAAGPPTCKLLPFALDINTWNACVAGSGPDNFQYDPDTQAVSNGSDHIEEVLLYPYKNITAGNFGTVNLGQTNNSTAILNRQILDGPNAADMANMGGQIALGADGTLTLIGNPGLSAAIKAALQEIIGEPRIIPLYSSVALTGANTQYTIVGFAGIVIEKATLTGLHKGVVIQPEFVEDSTAFTGTSTTSSKFVYTGLQLCR